MQVVEVFRHAAVVGAAFWHVGRGPGGPHAQEVAERFRGLLHSDVERAYAEEAFLFWKLGGGCEMVVLKLR